MNKDFCDFQKFIKDKKTAVVGIGISNRPLIDFLIELGARVTAFDKKTKKEIGDIAIELETKGVTLIVGEDYLDFLKGYEVIFKTPSMRIDSPALVKAKQEGAYITSEMEEFVRYCPAKVIGVTGSDGKTTTTTLIYNILKEEGYKTWVGGNIGTPLFTRIKEMKSGDRVVLELSSFQLMTMDVSPQVSIITNLSPNHLDIHKDMKEYINAKKNVYKFQEDTDLLILNKDNDITADMADEANGKVMEFSRKYKVKDGAYFSEGKLYVLDKFVCNKEDIVIKGMHNVENFLAAFCATTNDASIKSMKKVATTFSGVEHRSEFIRELDGVKYYNDSIASSPTRTLASLRAFEKKVILIAGGYDKNIPFEPLAQQGSTMIKKLILLGNTKDKIEAVFNKFMKDKKICIPIIKVNTLEEAVNKAKSEAESGDIVTLSPACASFDMFPNFEVRGNKFKEIVNKI
ncbi:UDP-N-acetylmuramoyl-L-alanine--D-glutamate ligase [Clostridium arbusti]|uniref:UDP-N-acetylmuramoyl-L-alanine--D-glutamate ligase n=1 Tax=Clostridium arbusti TaxID=1137848 RepID=UPI000287AF09|nr:UDP-N-acetylmuramoyl-L-alanine--D-glutamate ligase [Clostridium arbusti]